MSVIAFSAWLALGSFGVTLPILARGRGLRPDYASVARRRK